MGTMKVSGVNRGEKKYKLFERKIGEQSGIFELQPKYRFNYSYYIRVSMVRDFINPMIEKFRKKLENLIMYKNAIDKP